MVQIMLEPRVTAYPYGLFASDFTGPEETSRRLTKEGITERLPKTASCTTLAIQELQFDQFTF